MPRKNVAPACDAARWPTVTDESARLNIPKQNLQYWIRTGRVEGRREGKHVCVNPVSLQEFFAARERLNVGFYRPTRAA